MLRYAMLLMLVGACQPTPVPVTDPSIGPLSNAPELTCTSPAISPLVVKLSALYPQWSVVATTASEPFGKLRVPLVRLDLDQGGEIKGVHQ